MNKELRYPLMLGDGRTRPVSLDYIKDNWPALWDEVVGLRHDLEAYLEDERAGPVAKVMVEGLDTFFAENPELKIPTGGIVDFGEEYGWPEWFQKLTGIKVKKVDILIHKKD
jgi:hypothetical protein